MQYKYYTIYFILMFIKNLLFIQNQARDCEEAPEPGLKAYN